MKMKNIVSIIKSVSSSAVFVAAVLCIFSVNFAKAQNLKAKTEITGKVLGGDGQPIKKAFVALSRGYTFLNTAAVAVAEADKDGNFRLETNEKGLFLLLFSGVNHIIQKVPLMVNSPKKVALNVKLFVPEHKEDLSEATIGTTNLKKQPDGTYSVEIETTEKQFEYLIGRGFKIRGVMQGHEPGNYKLTKSGVFILKEAIPVDGKVKIVLDPAKLPPASGPVEVRFGNPKSDDAKLYAIYHEMESRNSQEFQPKPRIATAEEINELLKRISKEKKLLLREALWLSYLELTLVGNKPDAALTAKALDALASSPSLWILSFFDLVNKAVAAANQPDKYADYVKNVLAKMPVDDRIGKPVPSFSAHSLEDPKVVYTNANIKAKVYLIDFWATWCGPCIGQMPYLHRAYEKYHAKGFEILSYSVDKNPDLVISFRKRKNTPMPWLNAIDPQLKEIYGEVPKQFGISGLPAAFLIDANGKILASGVDIEGEDLEKMLAKIFGEPKAAKL